MKAILIDAGMQTIREIDTDASLASLQQIVGGYIEAIVIEPAHHCFVDEEARLKNSAASRFFMLAGLSQPLIGRGIVIGHDAEGNTAPCSLSLDWVTERVQFIESNALADEPPT